MAKAGHVDRDRAETGELPQSPADRAL